MKYKYLIGNRLNDVITLIQILAFSQESGFIENEITGRFERKALSANSWQIIAFDHPEFFSINKNQNILLNYRRIESAPMSYEQTIKLVDLACSMHDKEISRKNKNSYRGPIYVAICSTILSTFVSFYSMYLNSLNNQSVKPEKNKCIIPNKDEFHIYKDTIIYK
jgi:hypothetical protein